MTRILRGDPVVECMQLGLSESLFGIGPMDDRRHQEVIRLATCLALFLMASVLASRLVIPIVTAAGRAASLVGCFIQNFSLEIRL